MSGAAQDEPRLDRILGMVDALRAELEELRSLSQEVPKLDARTEELEQFVDGLKPDGADPVVRRAEHHHALGAMEAGWKEGDNRVREELATTQTLAQELKARVDEFAALKAQVDSVVARVPDDRQSQWIQGLYLELEQRVQEDVKRRLDATLKEYRRDSSTTHQQNQLDGVTDRMNKFDDRMNNFGFTISAVRFETDAIKEDLRELDAKLEGSPMPRMARGAARGGMRGIPLNGRPAEAADVGVEGNAGATGSARGRRGDRRLTFEGERAPEETPEGAEYRRGSGGRPSMFRFDQETDERAEEEHGAPSTPRRYYLTASQVLDPQFTSEDCPLSLRDGDSSAPPDPKQEKELPAKCQWWGKRTMFEAQDAKSQGICAAITELQLHFKHENILTSRRRTTALEKMLMSGADRQYFLGMVKVREHALSRKLTYEEARRLCLDLFCPNDFLAQSLNVWRKNLDQGARPGSQWLASMLQYRRLCDNMTPGAEPAFSDAFFALLLRAGVSESIENEIARTDYAVYDSADAMERIDQVSRRLPNDGAGTKASVNRLHGQEMDPATVAAVKMANVMAEVNRTAVVYSGALAELMKERGISEQEFQRRKQEKECVWCSSKDHFLFSCPDYVTHGLNKSRAQGQQQGRADYKRELKDRVLSRADAQRHFRRTGEVAGAHARANVVEGTAATALDKDRGREIERGRYAPAIGGRSLSRSLSRGLSSSSVSSAGSDAFAFVSDDDDTGAGNGNGAGH
jgi:hypothetical protein